MLRLGGQSLELTDGTGEPQGVDINDLGQVVWGEWAGSYDVIKMWDNGEVVTVIEDGGNPRISDNGDIAFTRWSVPDEHLDIWLLHGGVFSLLPDAGYGGYKPSMNNRGVVAWVVYQNEYGDTAVWLMRRIAPKGGFDHDCHIDYRDLAQLQRCFKGADVGPPGGFLADCTRGDFDEDGDIDVEDFDQFLGAVTGPDATVPGCEP